MGDFEAQLAHQMYQEAWNRYVLECKELIENLKHILKGETRSIGYVEDKGEKIEVEVWKVPDGIEPPINETGFHHTVLVLQGLLDKNMATGNLLDVTASELANANLKALVAVYRTNYKNFGFKSISEVSALLSVITAQLVNHFSKSIGLALIKELASQYTINEQTVRGLPEQKSNLNV